MFLYKKSLNYFVFNKFSAKNYLWRNNNVMQRSRPPRHRRLDLVIGSHHPRAQVRHPRPDQAPRQPRQHIVVQPQPGRQQQPGRGGRPR